jgi:hypothetical protein
VVITTAFTLPLALVGAHTPIPFLMVTMFLRGTGIALCFVPTMTAAFASLRHSELSDATPQLNVMMRVGGSFGTAILADVLQRAATGAHSVDQAAAAFGTAFWWALGMAAVSIIPCLWLRSAERKARTARREDMRSSRAPWLRRSPEVSTQTLLVLVATTSAETARRIRSGASTLSAAPNQ